jgi:hypothetical protein
MPYLRIVFLLLVAQFAMAQTKPILRMVELYEKKVTIMLPDDFTPMSYAQVAVRYDPKSPPDYVYSGVDKNVNIAFSNSYQIAPADEAGMKELINNLKGSLEKTHPALFWIGTSTSTQSGKPVGKLEFKSLSPDNLLVYNILYLLNVKDQVVIANFSCECSSADALVATGKQVMASIKLLK